MLQPQFDRVTEQFNLGGHLVCEVVPGVVTLGLFGGGDKLDRSLVACVDDNAQLARAVAIEPAAVTGIEYATASATDQSGVLGLGSIAPWLPDVKAAHGADERFHVSLSVTDAAWESLPALGRVFEGQNHGVDCYPTLCQDGAQFVYKVLRGKVKVAIRAENSSALKTGVTVLGGGAQFIVESQSSSNTTTTLSSKEALVLGAIARHTKDELTDEGHCDGCGERGQACCINSTKCDDALVCLDSVCRQHGYPGTPCVNGGCLDSAACVRGTCRTGCGTEGLPCCDRDACSSGTTCHPSQPARREIFIVDEFVERSGGLFGTDASIELGLAACGDGRLRSRFATTRLAGDSSHCDRAVWMGDDANDCRVRVDLHVSPLSRIRCRVQVLATELDPRVPAPQALCK